MIVSFKVILKTTIFHTLSGIEWRNRETKNTYHHNQRDMEIQKKLSINKAKPFKLKCYGDANVWLGEMAFYKIHATEDWELYKKVPTENSLNMVSWNN